MSDNDATLLFAPAGFEMGGETACGIALAIVTEVQVALPGRTGAPLRERQGAIHDEFLTNEREVAFEAAAVWGR